MARDENRYKKILARIFQKHYKQGVESFEFSRSEIEKVARQLKLKSPKNPGDVLYAFRYRRAVPDEIAATAPPGKEWILESVGRSQYRFRLDSSPPIRPREDMIPIKIPDSTPEIVARYALGDEQALLAKVRYNRLVDIFLGLAAYSLQNHLRTSVKGRGQVEVDELYVGVNRQGVQFIIPVQAKGSKDQLGTVQTRQDIDCCREKFPSLIVRPVAAQFLSHDVIVMFELSLDDNNEVCVVDERHYQLVPADEVSPEDLKRYALWERPTR